VATEMERYSAKGRIGGSRGRRRRRRKKKKV
jgi:hypothetical protein